MTDNVGATKNTCRNDMFDVKAQKSLSLTKSGIFMDAFCCLMTADGSSAMYLASVSCYLNVLLFVEDLSVRVSFLVLVGLLQKSHRRDRHRDESPGQRFPHAGATLHCEPC